jgi:hypothetical protein
MASSSNRSSFRGHSMVTDFLCRRTSLPFWRAIPWWGRRADRIPEGFGFGGAALGSRAPRAGAAPTARRVRFRVGSSGAISNSGGTLGASGIDSEGFAPGCALPPRTCEIAPCGPTPGALSRLAGLETKFDTDAISYSRSAEGDPRSGVGLRAGPSAHSRRKLSAFLSRAAHRMTLGVA